jgi:tetratricopeptide (TPR) repeat protein
MEIDEVEETTTTTQFHQFHRNNPLPNIANLNDEIQFNNDDLEEIILQHSDIDSSASNQWSKPTTVNTDDLAVALAKLGIRVSPGLLVYYKNPTDNEDSDLDTELQQAFGPAYVGALGTESCSSQERLIQPGISSRNIQNKKTRNILFSPYSGISVFPAHTKKASYITWDIYVENTTRKWPMEMKRLRSKLRLPMLCNKERISTLDRLMSVESSMYCADSSTCKELLKALKNEPEPERDRSRITKIYLKLIEELLLNSKLQEVPKFFREYRNELSFKIQNSDNKINLTSPKLLYLQAFYHYRSGHYHKAENILRSLICFVLTQFQSFNDFTIELLRLYNTTIQKYKLQENLVEVENIYRFNMRIYSSEVTDFNFKLWYDNALSLLRYFLGNSKYKEGQSLCSHLIKRTKLVFGIKSNSYFECQIQQAYLWRKQGKLSQAFDLLYQLSKNSEVTEVIEYNLFDEIGHILWEKKDFSAAASWWKKTIERRVVLYGLQHPNILVDFKNLGSCYEVLRQWEAALKLYSKFVENLRKIWGVKQSSVEQVEGWILHVKEEIEMIARESESESDRGKSKNKEKESESKRDKNADRDTSAEGVGDIEFEQYQTGDNVEDIDWEALHSMSPSVFNSE